MPTPQNGAKAVFDRAVEIEGPADRAAFVGMACAGDAGLRARVEVLLRAHAAAGSFLEQPAVGPLETISPDTAEALTDPGANAQPGAGSLVAGRYRLLEVIGAGGMGTVWRAEQQEPVRRQVAVKLIKPGMDSEQVVARFGAERQALALMDHPNIARVLDGGATADGRPFFVMELVKGVPITKYCDANRLPPRQRLELFVPVCHAVQHAHQKGVIHRDVKPSNVLVAEYDGKPVPKVIDFGIAKATGQPLTERTAFTGIGSLVGTLEYMSPEQACFDSPDVDTRTDIYSLGVMLYELLVGSLPFPRKELDGEGLLEALRVIREQEPPRPSARLGAADTLPALAADRRTEPRKLVALVHGELDWVVMKALEKDRNRRYETAGDLARDIQHHLADEPVGASPPTLRYRLRKFARRNRRALTTLGLLGAMLLVTMAAAAGGIGWAVRDRTARQADADREQAERLAENERELDRTLQEAGQFRDRGDWPKAKAAVQRAEWLVAAGGSDASTRRVRQMTADLALVARLEEIRSGDPQTPVDLFVAPATDRSYAEAFRDCGIDVAALDATTAAERVRASAIRAQLGAALDDWLWAKLCKMNRMHRKLPEDGAEYDHLRAVADSVTPTGWFSRVRDPEVQKDRTALEELADRPEIADLPPATAMLLARLLVRSGSKDRAVVVLGAIHERHPDDFHVNNELGVALSSGDELRREQAAGYFRAAIALRPQNPMPYCRLALVHRKAGRLDQAVAAYRRAWEVSPPNSNANVFAFTWLVLGLEQQGKWDESLADHIRFARLNHDYHSQSSLAWAYRRRRQWANAIAAFREACRLAPKPEPCHTDLAWLLANCPDQTLRDAAQALELATLAVEHAANHVPGWQALGAARYRTGDWDGAVAALEQAQRRAKNQGSKRDSTDVWFFLAMARWQRGEHEEARRDYDRAVELSKEQEWSDGNLDVKEELDCLRAEAEALIPGAAETRRLAEAAELAARAAADRRQWDKVIAESSKAIELRPNDAVPRQRRAVAHTRLGQFDNALSDYAEVAKRQPDSLEAAFEYAGALLLTGDTEGYKRLCADLLERGDKLKYMNQPGRLDYLLARISLLAPDAVADPDLPSRLANSAVKAQPRAVSYLHTLSLAHYRAGRHADAVKRFEESARTNPKWSAQPVNWLVLAMARHRLGQTDQARQWLDKAVRTVDRDRAVPPKGAPTSLGMHPHDWMAWLLLRREAEALITGESE
jgi:serine/threonine protein kinase/Flp pilus assembly protein TadD